MGAAEKSRRISTRRERARSEGNVHRVRSWFVQFGRQWQLQAMILPGIIFMIVFNFIPIYGLVLAFKQYTVVDTIEDAPWVGWQNFETILKDQYFLQSVVNTLGISFIKLTLGFLLPIVLAVMIYEIPWTPFKKIVQTLTYLPHFFFMDHPRRHADQLAVNQRPS